MGATRLEQCPYDANVLNNVQKTRYFPILEILENDFKCSGFCTETNFFLFSDVRNGPPSGGTSGSVDGGAGPQADPRSGSP